MNEVEIKVKENGNGESHSMTEFTQPKIRLSLRSMRAAAEIQAISLALEETGWNRKRAAQLLRISYRGLLYKIRQHNITPTVEGSMAAAFAERLKVG